MQKKTDKHTGQLIFPYLTTACTDRIVIFFALNEGAFHDLQHNHDNLHSLKSRFWGNMNPWPISFTYLSKIIYFFLLQHHLIIPNFLLGLKMITVGLQHGILARVGSAFTTLLNMQCWKLNLTEIVNRNANYSFFELVRQIMKLKLPQWHRKYALFSNLLTKPI